MITLGGGTREEGYVVFWGLDEDYGTSGESGNQISPSRDSCTGIPSPSPSASSRWNYAVHPDKYSIVLTKFMMMKQDYLFEYSCNGASDKLRAGPIMVGAERVRDWGDARNEEGEEQVENGLCRKSGRLVFCDQD
ncbi:unnamed protein product [Brassica napus]|uniref:(rape) hypothetical protein n=1 Tax=Brassica napus TaxID=3708 RepID=A0A816ZJG2_BRANA|nr:unnamed protein product [Brassica napus]